ncbi:hypothetical protein LTR08_001447 [Meristemomyces frigidus]|nr:hypothetical protein LTR08_001447 [Meristemomyces frigidus]
MARAVRQATAAYAASQVLFDALRNATGKINEQKLLLTQARDLVQTLHVKLAHGGHDAAKQHDLYIDHVVKAWRSATEAYSQIFEELASITAADASEGKAARKGHEDFVAIAASVEAAKNVAMRCMTATHAHTAKPTKKARVEDALDEETEEVEEVQSGDEASSALEETDAADTTAAADPQDLTLLGKRPLPADENKPDQPRPKKVQRLSENTRLDSQGKKVPWEPDAATPNVPGTLDASEKKAWSAEKTSQKREKRRLKTKGGVSTLGPDRRANPSDALDTANQPVFGQSHIPLSAEPASAGKENSLPGLEYEDVSAEVEARLKAKEEKKKAKKEEKKRKRESGDSLPEPLPVEAVAEKPQKKKVKTKAATEANTSVPVVDRLEKRNRRVSIAEDPAEGRRKRVKSK